MDTGEAESLTECILSDVSEGGAKLKLSHSISVPPKFSLRLTRDGPPARLCQLIWQEGLDIGIKFIKLAPEEVPGFMPVRLAKR
jgi:hypothetical protein